MNGIHRYRTRFGPLLIASILWGSLITPSCLADTFPNPPAIQPTVQFWLSIYTQYPLTQGVVHDSRYPDIVYEIIQLKHPGAPRANRTNEHRMRQARNTYRNILDRLIEHPDSKDPEVRRVADLFGAAVTPSTAAKSKTAYPLSGWSARPFSGRPHSLCDAYRCDSRNIPQCGLTRRPGLPAPCGILL